VIVKKLCTSSNTDVSTNAAAGTTDFYGRASRASWEYLFAFLLLLEVLGHFLLYFSTSTESNPSSLEHVLRRSAVESQRFLTRQTLMGNKNSRVSRDDSRRVGGRKPEED
jgi:hypothetical protein